MSDVPPDVERWAAAADWSRRTTLNPMETVLGRSERHPVQSSTSCVLIELDRVPDWERFVAAHEWGTRLVARLRQRVLDPVLPTAPPTWVDDEAFQLSYHLRRERVASREEALELAAQIAMRPFDRTRPLWEGVLLEGQDGGAAYLLKIHHALADPLGTVQLLSLLQSGTREHTPDKPVAGPDATTPAPDAVELTAAGLRADVAAAPASALRLGLASLQAALAPGATLGSALRYGASLRRLLSRPPAPPSELFAGRTGRSWNFLTLSAPLESLRVVGREAGGSLEDVAVTLLLGGLRRYHERHGLAPEELPVAVRVSLDRADDLGNRYAGAMIAAPVGIEDPVDRTAAVRGEVLSLHTERALEAFSAFAPLANRLPSGVGAAALAAGAAADAFVLTLPGPPRSAYMAGARVEAMYSFGPLPGVAVTATLLTVGDRACLGLNVDGTAVPDLDLFAQCLQEGLEELD